jgi:hypothetical protein
MASILPLVAPMQKLREVFVLQAVMEKNLSRFLKIRFHLPRNSLRRRHDEQAKMGENEKSGFFFWDGWYSGPPLRW